MALAQNIEAVQISLTSLLLSKTLAPSFSQDPKFEVVLETEMMCM